MGLRYDRFGYHQPTTLNNNAGLAARVYAPTSSQSITKILVPRLGLAYRPFNDEKTVVRASYGIFYSRTPGLMLSTAILQNGIDVLTYTLTSGFPTFPNILRAPPASGLAPPNINVFDPNYSSPRVQQYNFQIEQALGANYAVTLGLYRRPRRAPDAHAATSTCSRNCR